MDFANWRNKQLLKEQNQRAKLQDQEVIEAAKLQDKKAAKAAIKKTKAVRKSVKAQGWIELRKLADAYMANV